MDAMEMPNIEMPEEEFDIFHCRRRQARQSQNDLKLSPLSVNFR